MVIRCGMFLFCQFIAMGRLSITLGKGGLYHLDSGQAGPHVTIHLAHHGVFWRILMKPDLAIGEAYMDGTLVISDGTLDDFMNILMASNNRWQRHWLGRLAKAGHATAIWWWRLNMPYRAKANVAHHYDLKDSLFDQFLDPRRQYSCAYFNKPDDPLADAQITKLARLAAKLCLRPGQRVLDIGCGWGGLANALWEIEPRTRITGITLSENQLTYAQQHAAEQGRGDQIDFHLRDYRHQTGRFERIVSVGMLEHVGAAHFNSYFATIARLLTADGLAVVHAIGVNATMRRCNRWLNKYIFPGGYLPSLEQIVACCSRHGLKIIYLEILRGHYAETLRQWRIAFEANIDLIKQDYDDRFVRMWRFYLAGCEYFFRHQDGMVFQMQLAHDYNSVPATRRYIAELEDSYRTILCRDTVFGQTRPLKK